MIALAMDKPGWYCPSEIDMRLIGQVFSTVRSHLRFRILPCKNTTSTTPETECASQEAIESFMHGGLWNMAWLAYYFDEDEFYHNPVKYEVNVAYFSTKID